MNKFLKAIVGGSFVLVAIVFVVLGFIFYRLPSAKSLSKVVQKNVTSSTKDEFFQPVPVAPPAKLKESTPASISSTTEADSAADAALGEKVFRDLTAPENPLSNFCGSLKNAKTGEFSQDGFEDAFLNSVDPETQDPRIQAAKPLFRYILRLPKMNQFVSEIEQAANKKDQGLLDKAQFYASAFSAFSEMKHHQTDLESVLDRGYIFIGLNNLVAKKPELLNDPKVQSFCDNTEALFNQSTPVDFDREKIDFLNLVKESGLRPQDIAFDPQYKSKVDLRLDGNALTLDGGWLEDLIKEDQTIPSDTKIE